MLGLNRQNQSSIYKNVKKVGWTFTAISFIIIAIGLGLFINYALKINDTQPKDDMTKITSLINYLNSLNIPSSGRDQVLQLRGKLILTLNAIKDLNDNYISNIETAMNIFCAGIICFFCIRIAVNAILIFRAYDDKMTIIESNALFSSRLFHHIFIIICQIIALVLFSIVFPEYISSVIQEFNKYLDSLQLWAQSSINKTSQVNLDEIKTPEQEKVLTDIRNLYNRLYAYYFNPNTKLGDFKPLYNLFINSSAIPTYNEIKKTVQPILWNRIYDLLIVMGSFIGAWFLFNTSNSIVSVVIIAKFDKDNDPLQPKKVMFDKNKRRVAYI